ncbi:helix-hairpin-helix domain-containing protein [Streptomyces sp. B1866]|uniref:helix-hairpin-helix domain-containing protein n=1 Tax=Streptomyces sp. B1866 TaxID=3075431 RepID=UPI00288CE1A5|nr:helix-hairpin-helix domain-containing protein [Streptomyces sp. B1866]MDT3397004.1 helix-hairpin-helix domain-containing protein [Streptomyces sp. B1866]
MARRAAPGHRRGEPRGGVRGAACATAASRRGERAAALLLGPSPCTDPTVSAVRPGRPAGPLVGGPPPDPAGSTVKALPAPAADGPRELSADEGPADPAGSTGSPLSAGPDGPASRAAGRLWLALRERLPLWLQLRCGIEPRTLAALAVVLLVAAGFAAHHFWTGRPQTVRPPARTVPRTAAPEAGPRPGAVPPSGARPTPRAGPSVVVDVTGRVRSPGVYRLPAGTRVGDALKAAGGPRPGADTAGLNQARVLTDGEQIVVGAPAAGGPAGGAPGGAAQPAGVPPQDGAAGSGAAASRTPVSLSSATAEQLDALPGVGPVLARHIINYRTQRGGVFRSVDELREVTGIGERRFADLRPLVRP